MRHPRTKQQRRRERHFICELLHRFVGADADGMIADIEAYAEGRATYGNFLASWRFWVDRIGRHGFQVRREIIDAAFHREANLAAETLPLYLRYHGPIGCDNPTRIALAKCQYQTPPAKLPRDPVAVKLAQTIHDERDWGLMPLLYDALLDADVDEPHCKSNVHGRGCYVLEGLL